MKINIIIISLIFLFSKNIFAKINDNIDPYCIGIEEANKLEKLKDFSKIQIITNNLKLKKQVFRKIKSKKINDVIYDNWINGQLILISKYNNRCTLKIKLRITGDGSEHYDNEFNSSIRVKIKKNSFLGIKNFRLFLPASRNGYNEVIGAKLFKAVGLLSPRTSFVSIFINEKKIDYIFQEELSKEMIEFNNFNEGPIFESNEKLQKQKIISSKIVNEKWSGQNEFNLKSSLEAQKKLNFHYHISSYSEINNVADMNLNEDFYDKEDEVGKLIYNKFEALSFAINGEHLLNRGDRKFYFDPVYGRFIPIYFDSRTDFFNLSFDNKIITKSAKNGIDEVLLKLENLDKNEFLNSLLNDGVIINQKQLEKIFEGITNNLIEMRNFQTSNGKKIDKNIFDDLLLTREDTGFIFIDDLNQKKFNICDIELNCEIRNFDTEEILKAINQKFYYNNKYYELIGYSKSELISKKINYDKSIFNLDKKIKIKDDFNDFIIKLNKNIKININQDKRIIEFNKYNEFDQIFVFGNKIYNWNFKLNDFSTSNQKYDETKYLTKYHLTGCLNFYDIELKNLNLEIFNSICEDAVNFKRVSGKINNIKVINSKFDGADYDYSYLEIHNSKIENAKNDCIDFSKGKYILLDVVLENCLDKSISIGESSNLNIENAKIYNSNFGIAVKDSSHAKINNIDFFDTNICYAIYRKKEEFYGAILNIKNINCKNNNFFVQTNSKIYLDSND